MKVPCITSILLFSWVLSLPVNANSLPYNNKTLDCNLQTQIDVLVPPAPKSLPSSEQNLVSNTAMELFRQTPGQIIMVHLPIKQKQNNGIERQLSAIGIRWDLHTGTVLYVDKNSDLYTKVLLGDVFLSEDGISANLAMQQRINFGNKESLTRLSFLQHGAVIDYACHRHPVSWFSLWFQQQLMSNYGFYPR